MSVVGLLGAGPKKALSDAGTRDRLVSDNRVPCWNNLDILAFIDKYWPFGVI